MEQLRQFRGIEHAQIRIRHDQGDYIIGPHLWDEFRRSLEADLKLPRIGCPEIHGPEEVGQPWEWRHLPVGRFYIDEQAGEV